MIHKPDRPAQKLLLDGLLIVLSAIPPVAKPFIDYFLPTPIVGALNTNVWGAATVWPRDPKNGLDDAAMKKWDYWDGKIIVGPDVFVNNWSNRRAYRLNSRDGVHDWTYRGVAYDATQDFVRYTDSNVNHWHKLEPPGVCLENGHVATVTLAVIDVPKNQETRNGGHGSKVIVVPFDGAGLDRDLQNADK